ncbi:MAG: roadblock/LC7 domain-containing protein [Candidatus Hodarchaeota archaeon]
MIICQNCGTTNNEKLNKVCRTCGALLPVPSKHHRISEQKTDKGKKKVKKLTQKSVKDSDETKTKKKEKLDLQEIPKEPEIITNSRELQEIPIASDEVLKNKAKLKDYSHSEEVESKILQEIAPQPYKGSILDSHKESAPQISRPYQPTPPVDTISDAFLELKNSVMEKKAEKPSIPISTTTTEPSISDNVALKQKQLEKDMTKVLSFLSKKITVKKLEIPKAKTEKKEEAHEEIPPSSMNDILKRLLTLDLNIEASAIIKTDGTILASAISSRISDSLFATIGMNLSMIGSDIIEGLGAGTLKSISLKASDGVLDLAPIDKENPRVKDMFLILFSHPKVKSGIISFAVNIVKKQLKEYLAIEK